MVRIILFFLLFYTLGYGFDFPYQFGRGIYLKNIWIGGYFSVNYWKKNSNHSFSIDDIALLSKFSYRRISLFSEIETKDIYLYSSEEKNRYWKLKPEIERLYLEYNHNEYFNVKIGRFLTPLGIWNKVHIDALKWTVSDPLVSTEFFPMFTTGLGLYGYISEEKNIKYNFFLQKNKSINASYNNLKTDDILGFQIEKTFSIHKKAGLNFGIFDEDRLNEKYRFLGLYGKTKIKNFYLSSEAYYAYERKKGDVKHKEFGKVTYYLQSVYRIFSKNYLVFRKDGLYDSSDKHHVDVWTFCWNYRPRFNISFKFEYQLFERREDYIKISFAMLF